MLTRRCSSQGLFAMLLALAMQLGLGASGHRLGLIADLAGADLATVQTLCHSGDPATPAPLPTHPPDCLVCLLCSTTSPPAVILPAGEGEPPSPFLLATARAELPPPSQAPPLRDRPPSQPRAPPFLRLHA